MTQDEMIELAKQAGWQYAHGESGFEPLWEFAKLVAAKTIAELESQELKQITVKDFVHMVEGKEDLIGRPVYFAQWPNGNTHPPQRTWVGLSDKDIDHIYTGVRAVHHDVDSYVFCQAIEARLKQNNGYVEEKNT